MSLCCQYCRCVDVIFMAAVCVRACGHQCGRVTLTKKKNPCSSLAWCCCGLNFDKLEIFQIEDLQREFLPLEALLHRCDL